MGLFTTRQLLGYTEQKVKFRALFLELFFRRTITFHTQEVMLDKITGKTPVAAYVSPVVSGKVLRSRGGETRVLRPGYVKPKHRFDYQQAVERLPGEDPARLNDPAYRRLRILTDNLKQEEQAIVQVEEMQAVSAVLQGKYTMSGEQFETVEVDFGRSVANNITQAGGREWSQQNADTFDPTHDLDAYCDFASGTINIAIMDGTVWRMLNGFKLFREKLDTQPDHGTAKHCAESKVKRVQKAGRQMTITLPCRPELLKAGAEMRFVTQGFGVREDHHWQAESVEFSLVPGQGFTLNLSLTTDISAKGKASGKKKGVNYFG
ncbi:hypothetical protein EB657_23340 [Escherichia coli]|nr:hypothetical protein [Escherichia coli]